MQASKNLRNYTKSDNNSKKAIKESLKWMNDFSKKLNVFDFAF